MKNISLVGRVIYGVVFLVFGAFHLMQAQAMAGFVPSFFPGSGAMWVVLTGIVFVLAGLALLANKWVKEAGLLIALQLLVFILAIWLPQLGGETGRLLWSAY